MSIASSAIKLRRKRYDLPLYRGSGGQLVTWIVGVMAYLTVLSLVLIFGLNDLQHFWEQGLSGHLTVEIAYDDAKKMSTDDINNLVHSLNTLPKVQARQLIEDDIAELVGPWLGTGARLADLPLPVLIDVERGDDKRAASEDAIANKLHQLAPQATLDTHQEWLAELLKLAQACRMVLIAIAFILALTTALTVAATARTRLALHKDEVDLLHLIGATDHYIANQFQRQAFRLASEGAAIGLGLGVITLLIIGFIKHQLGDTLVPGFSLSWLECFCLLLTPLVAGGIAMVASRFTVLRALKDMP